MRVVKEVWGGLRDVDRDAYYPIADSETWRSWVGIPPFILPRVDVAFPSIPRLTHCTNVAPGDLDVRGLAHPLVDANPATHVVTTSGG